MGFLFGFVNILLHIETILLLIFACVPVTNKGSATGICHVEHSTCDVDEIAHGPMRLPFSDDHL